MWLASFREKETLAAVWLIRRFPFTFGLLTVLVCIYALEIVQSRPAFWLLGRGALPAIAAWGMVWTPAIASGEWWRLLTAGFLHGSLLHLALNGCALAVIGTAAERRLGSWRTTAVFLAAVIGGNLTAAIIDRDVPSLGASGGIMGIAGAVMVAVYRSKEGVERSQWVQWVLSAIAATVIYGFLHAGISNAAHIGGLLTGGLVAWPLGLSSEYVAAAAALSRARQETIDALASNLTGAPPDIEERADDRVLRPSWSLAGIAVMGLLLFGSGLAIEAFVPGAPLAMLIVLVLMVLLTLVMLASLPSTRLRLSLDGFTYSPPYWRKVVTVPWKAVIDVSVYGFSAGYGTQNFARVTYVANAKERRVVLTRLGNLKAEKLVALIQDYWQGHPLPNS